MGIVLIWVYCFRRCLLQLSYVGFPASFFPSSMSTSMSLSLLGSVERKNKKMKCFGACGLVAQCNEYQLVAMRELYSRMCFPSYNPYGNPLFSLVVPYSWCVRMYMFLGLHSASVPHRTPPIDAYGSTTPKSAQYPRHRPPATAMISIIVIIKPTDDEISPSLPNHTDFICLILFRM